MRERVANVMRKARKAGTLVKCEACKAYHFGGVTKESFDVEPIAPGESPVLLPHGDGEPTASLTLQDVKNLIRKTLEASDAKKAKRK